MSYTPKCTRGSPKNLLKDLTNQQAGHSLFITPLETGTTGQAAMGVSPQCWRIEVRPGWWNSEAELGWPRLSHVSDLNRKFGIDSCTDPEAAQTERLVFHSGRSPLDYTVQGVRCQPPPLHPAECRGAWYRDRGHQLIRSSAGCVTDGEDTVVWSS